MCESMFVLDWDARPSDDAEENLVYNVVTALQELEFRQLRCIQQSREGEQAELFSQIVGCFVVTAFRCLREDGSRQFQFNPENCPFGYEPQADDGPDTESVTHILSLLSHPDCSYLGDPTPIPTRAGDPNTIGVSVGPELLELLGNSGMYDVSLSEAAPESLPEVEQQVFVESEEKESNPLDHSRLLDVHTWSDHPEVNAFVDQIYERHFVGGNPNIRKKHLKVILLDLYLAWSDDPELKIAFSRDVNSYKPKSRYNALKISKLTPTIVDVLVETGLVEQAIGFWDRETEIGRYSRIWPRTPLVRMFEEAKFGVFDIGNPDNRECINLRKNDDSDDHTSNDIEYTDTDETNRMRVFLNRYNEFLSRTFIDIPSLDDGHIELDRAEQGKSKFVYVNQRDKFVRRIFNRSSFECGGRFFGGWWQRCPREWREQIFMNDAPVSEIDFSGLHIALLYAEAGQAVPEGDVYEVELPNFINNQSQFRAICKQLLLMAINARDRNSAFSAFRDKAPNGSIEKHYTNEQLGQILDILCEKHPLIADKIASDSGIRLMHTDSKITEKILTHFTNHEIPVLAVHDSYLVPYGMENELREQMTIAINQVAGIEQAKVEEVTHRPDLFEPMDLESAVGFDYSAWEAAMEARHNPIRSDRYLASLAQFQNVYGRIDYPHDEW